MHVLARQDQHAPKDITRLLTGIDHLRQPIERRVRIAAAQALDEGADRINVIVALFVIQHGAALNRLFNDGKRDADDTGRVGGGGLDCQL